MRISRHQMFMEMAQVVAKRSTCPRLNVGAIVVIDNRAVSIGYNGSRPKEPHCTDVGCLLKNHSCVRTTHAEVNALNHVPSSQKLAEKILYITDSPCRVCAGYIINFNVVQLYYGQPYRDTGPLDSLVLNGIEVYRVTPSGSIINHKTGEVIEA